MKILFINTYDTKGGAAKAAYRLFSGVSDLGIQAKYWVKHKTLNKEEIVIEQLNIGQKVINKLFRGTGNRIIRKLRGTNKTYWNYNMIPRFSQYRKMIKDSDIIHLHWIAEEFIPISLLAKFKKPIIWTLHDSWAFTGGCHIPMNCKGYMKDCSNCPQSKSRWLARAILKKKINVYKKLDLTIVTPSRWLAECVKSSSALGNLNVYVIPNGLDTNLFKPLDKVEMRRKLGLNPQKKYILFGAMGSTSDPNKGFQLLVEALQSLKIEDVELVVFGANKSDLDDRVNFKINYMGYVEDEKKIVEIYNAADIFVAPSLSESFCNTVMEAMACGVPAVAFNIGGIPDLIDHQINGYLAEPYKIDDFTKGIEWILEDHNTIKAEDIRNKVLENFDIKQVSKRYMELYKHIGLSWSSKIVTL